MFDDFREWLSDNLRYILLGLAIILVFIIVFCIVRLVTGGSRKTKNDNPQTVNTQTVDQQQEATTEAGEDAAATPSADAKAGSELVRNDAAVLTIAQKYYDAVAAKDVAALSQIVDPWNDTVEDKILSNDVIESYNNIATYSKDGVEAGSYVVFVYAEDKVTGYETLVPSLSRLYLVTGEGGDLVVKSDWDTDSAIVDYVDSVTSDADVRALRSDVTKQYETAINSDEDLKAFLEGISNSGSSSSDEKSEEGEADADSSTSGEMTAIADLNIRETPSTEANILGSVYQGTNVTVLEDAGDGWVHISYDTGSGTIQGYVRSEYLNPASAQTAA